MPYFDYEARGKDGKLTKSQAFALNRTELIKSLHDQGMVVLSVKDSASITARHPRKMHGRATARDMASFVKELAILLENGVTITDALEVISLQLESAGLVNAIKVMKRDLESGSTLKDAMMKHPRVFTTLWVEMIDAGETSGQIPFVLRQIEAIIKVKEELKKKTINAFIYPCILIFVATSTVFIFVYKVIPVFEDLFTSFGGELPAFTKTVISASKTLRENLIIIVAVLGVGGYFLRRWLSTHTGRRVFEKMLLALPVVGDLFISVTLGRFSSTLSVLLKSGIPIIRAMETSLKTSGSIVFEENIQQAKMKIVAGMPFSEAMNQTGLFPPIAAQLILVAEKTGNYSGMLEELSIYYNEVIDVAITRFTTLISPVMLIIMASIIGSLLVAMFLPIFKIATLGG